MAGRPEVSVPSSSGNSLQQSARKAGSVQEFVSVPSSSGNSLQPAATNSTMTSQLRFSPLFIGELSSTLQPLIVGVGWPSFSPLFIGELSSTQLYLLGGNQASLFQSPLHRGTLFNSHWVAEIPTMWKVSVPSSSGNSLQLAQAVGPMLHQACFSPLFIGELSSTALKF